jgi:hypothetical protein
LIIPVFADFGFRISDFGLSVTGFPAVPPIGGAVGTEAVAFRAGVDRTACFGFLTAAAETLSGSKLVTSSIEIPSVGMAAFIVFPPLRPLTIAARCKIAASSRLGKS